jgi:hypothetical protein
MKLKNARAIIEENDIHIFRRNIYNKRWRKSAGNVIRENVLHHVEFYLKIGDAEIPIMDEKTAESIHDSIQDILWNTFTVPRHIDTNNAAKWFYPLEYKHTPMRMESEGLR